MNSKMMPVWYAVAIRRVMLRLLIIIAVSTVFLGGCAGMKIVHVDDKKEVMLPELAERMRQARLILVGEAHNKKHDHDMQLAVIRTLHEAGWNIAIGMEMFGVKEQASLDRWVTGGISEREFIPIYKRNWMVPWPNYRDILIYAREHKIPVIGINVEREVVHQVFKSGLSSLTPHLQAMLPVGLKCDVSKVYETFIKKSVGDHEIKGAGYINFCEAQMVWDAFMARASVDYLNAHPDKVMVALAGSGHIWKHAIPRHVRRISDIPFYVILPRDLDWFEDDNITIGEADYMLIDRFEFVRFDLD